MSVNVYDPVNNELIPVAGATLYADAPVGSIIAFAGKEINLPEGYLAFNGQTVKRSDYPDLWAFAVANEQVGVDKFFSQGDGSTTFTLADLRETSLKGYGETSRSVGAHVKSGGLGVGEFIDDQLQNHAHNTGDNFWANNSVQSSTETNVLLKNWIAEHTNGNGIRTGRTGTTTEVKAVGVVWAVKAKLTGLPIDLKEQVENYVADLKADPVELIEQTVLSASEIAVTWTKNLSDFRFIIVEVRSSGINRGSMVFINRKIAYEYIVPFYYSGSPYSAEFDVNTNQTSGSIQIPNLPSSEFTVFVYGVK